MCTITNICKIYVLIFCSVGFSFGGIVACIVASRVWKERVVLSEELIKRKLICITFGQPLIKLRALENEEANFFLLIRQVYMKSDVVPQLMRFFNCKQLCPKAALATALMDIHSSNIKVRTTMHL